MGKVLGGVLAAVILIGGLWWFLGRPQTPEKMMNKQGNTLQRSEESGDKAMEQKEKSMLSKEDGTMKKDEKKMGQSGDTMMPSTGGKYLEYHQTVFEQSKNTRRVLFFYANWCPECHAADADFQKNLAQLPKDVTLIRVNYNDPSTDDEEKALAQQYGITYQHSFVQIDAMGTAVASWNGGGTEMLLSKLK